MGEYVDLINREEAQCVIIDELDRIDHVPRWVFERLSKRIKDLPSADIMDKGEYIDMVLAAASWKRLHKDADFRRETFETFRPQGEWITNMYAFGEDRNTCNQCGRKVAIATAFCPHCGADMRGER